MNCEESRGASDCPDVFYVNHEINLASLINVKFSLLTGSPTSTAVESLSRSKMSSCIILLTNFTSNEFGIVTCFPDLRGSVFL